MKVLLKSADEKSSECVLLLERRFQDCMLAWNYYVKKVIQKEKIACHYLLPRILPWVLWTWWVNPQPLSFGKPFFDWACPLDICLATDHSDEFPKGDSIWSVVKLAVVSSVLSHSRPVLPKLAYGYVARSGVNVIVQESLIVASSPQFFSSMMTSFVSLQNTVTSKFVSIIPYWPRKAFNTSARPPLAMMLRHTTPLTILWTFAHNNCLLSCLPV